jgi:hypothetical protein
MLPPLLHRVNERFPWPDAILLLYVGMDVSLKHLPDDMVHATGSGEESFLMFQSCDILNWSYAQLLHVCLDVWDRRAGDGLAPWFQQTTSLPSVDLTALAGNAGHAWSPPYGIKKLEIIVGGRLTDVLLCQKLNPIHHPCGKLLHWCIDHTAYKKNALIKPIALKIHNCNTHICDVLPSVPL